MRCPYCGSDNTQVKDSRPSSDNTSIRRRRVCAGCGGRFTTFERVQLRELTVLKRSGRRVPFDRDKLMRSVQVALRKRQVDPERVERMVSGIVRQLESAGDSEIPVRSDRASSSWEGLKRIDDVAYVRFASVYRNFREAKDFETLLGELSGDGSVLSSPKIDDEPARSIVSVEFDRRMMAAALRIGRRNLGRTSPNPASVRLSFSRNRAGGRIGLARLDRGRRAATCRGAGDRRGRRRGARPPTAYVSLEPLRA